MNKHIRIVELLDQKHRFNPDYQPSAAEIQALHKVLALLARIVMNKPKSAGASERGGAAPLTGRRAYRLFCGGGCHE